MPASYQVLESVAVIRFHRPPVNSLDLSMRSAILAEVRRAQSDSTVVGLVLTGSDTIFSAGADIREFAEGLTGGAFAAPTLADVIEEIAASKKPVIALVHGACLGGGFELALGCHERVIGQHATFALPEVKLGLIPGAGGTQRLPRLVGVDRAASLVVSGDPIDAAQAAALGIARQDLADPLRTAVSLARDSSLLERAAVSDAEPAALPVGIGREDYFVGKRNGLRRASLAALQCLRAIELSVTNPLKEGLRGELDLFRDLMQTPGSQALQYAFFSDRAAGQVKGIDRDTRLTPINRVAVIGAGVMGRGIALSAAGAGLPVTLIDTSQDAVDRAQQSISGTLDAAVRKGRLTAEQAVFQSGLVTATTDFNLVEQADLIIEAAFEDMGVKREIFTTLDERARPGAILASNTSTLDLNQIADATRRPMDVVGLHFFSPANVMRLLEVVRGRQTSNQVLASVMAFGRRIRKIAVVSGVCDGFIGNRMFEEYVRQAGFLLDEGALPSQVDHALEAWGMAMGPFAVIDLAGGDIAWAIRRRRAVEQPDRPYSTLPDKVHELGRYGQKTGAGFYQYSAGSRQREADPMMDMLVKAHSQELGLARRRITDEEIVARCILALVNEGAALLDEGIAQRSSDIDVVYRNGYGFPAERGGPMYYADRLGLPAVLQAMKGFESGYRGEFWRPAALLTRLAAGGERLNSV